MIDNLLSVRDAACRLGIQPTTLYDWLSRADYGLFIVRGQQVSIAYYQGGQSGQGRIRIEASEVERLKDLMRVRSMRTPPRRPAIRRDKFPGIHVQLGRPNQG